MINKLTGEINAMNATITHVKEDNARLKSMIQELTTSAQEKDKLHKNDLDVKNQLIKKLQGDIEDLNTETRAGSSGDSYTLEREYKQKIREIQSEYEGTVRELNTKIKELKDKINQEERNKAASSNFAFEDDDIAKVQIENEALQNKLRNAEEEVRDIKYEMENVKSDCIKYKSGMEVAKKELDEMKSNFTMLRSNYTKLEMANETLKQSGGNDKVTAANLRKFEELEKKYVKAKQ